MDRYSATRTGVGPPVELKPDLAVPQWAEAQDVRLDSLPGITIEVRADWNPTRFEYELTRLELGSKTGIASEDFRKLSRPDILHALLVGVTRYRAESGELEPLHISRELIERLKAKGNSPETLLWMSRLYAQFRAEGNSANKHIAALFDIPSRTANYWIASARTRGLLD